VRRPSFGRRATLLLLGATLTLGLSGCDGLCTGIPFFDAFFCRFNEPPVVVLTASPNPVVYGNPVTLDSSASTDDGEITARHWSTMDQLNDMLDGAAAVTRTFDLPNGGTVRPSVTLTDDEGGEGTGSVEVVVVPAGPNRLPVASIAVEEDPPETGRFTHFTGHWTDDGRIVRAEWDVDGIPGFEVDEQVPRGDTIHELRFTYADPGPYDVSFRVTDDRGGQATALVHITVVPMNQNPVADLSIPSSPPGHLVGQPITLDARGSTDDGGIVTYRFDKDGNFGNGFEYLDDGDGMTTTTFAAPGDYQVGVRVFDAQGLRDDLYAMVHVIEGRAAGATAARRGRPVRFSARLTAKPAPGAKVRIVRRGTVQRVRGVAATGRFNGRLARNGRRRAPKLLRAVLRAPWNGKIDAAVNTKTQRRRVNITALARTRRGVSCLRIRITDAPGRRPRGTFRVLGGTGAARGLTARGKFGLLPGSRVSGRVRAISGAPRRLSAACRAILGG
jgi:hypothetical protein